MQLYPHLVRDDTATVTVRLNKAELSALRRFMHTPEHFFVVGFPNGVRLFYRSMGWYQLRTTRNERAIDKLKVTLSILRKFRREYRGVVANDRVLEAAAASQTPVVAYTSDGTLAGKVHIKSSQEIPQSPKTPAPKITNPAPKKVQLVSKHKPSDAQLTKLEAMFTRRR